MTEAAQVATEWRMRADRCFVEFTVWRWWLPVMRGRLPGVGGRLTLGGEPRLRVDVDGAGVQGATWMLLFEAPYGRIRFRSTGFDWLDDDNAHVDGTLLVGGRRAPMPLRTRLIPVDGRALLIHATGRTSLAEVAPPRSGLPRAGRIDVLLAAEFRR